MNSFTAKDIETIMLKCVLVVSMVFHRGEELSQFLRDRSRLSEMFNNSRSSSSRFICLFNYLSVSRDECFCDAIIKDKTQKRG